MTTPTTQGATMTLPPCPIAGHDNPHHFHLLTDEPPKQHSADPGHPMRCDHANETVSRCYSAHVPEPSPDPDEWVRVPVGTRIPEGVTFRNEYVAVPNHFPVQPDEIAYLRRSDLDKLTPPDPAAKLAAALTKAGDGTWTAADVCAALKSAGLTLGAEK